MKTLFLRNQKLIDTSKKITKEQRAELIKDNRVILEAMAGKKDIVIRYETYDKLDNGRYYFVGWYPMQDQTYCIDTKIKDGHIYKTYKYQNGNMETVRYSNYIIEEA